MDSNDRELLELAAKGAGIDVMPMSVQGVRHKGDDQFIGLMVDPNQWSRGWFNPLEDDGDALRLAVQLSFHVEMDFNEEPSEVRVYGDWAFEVGAITEPLTAGWCRYAATRRAVVRAAAEIGRQSDD